MSDYGECGCDQASPDYTKGEGETLDFPFEWAPQLDGDEITSSSFSLPDGLTLVSQANTLTDAVIWVSGGECGRIYRIVHTIVTLLGRRYTKTIRIKVTE